MADLYETILGRRSVRTFDGRNLTAEDRAELEEYAKGLSNPFGIQVDFVFMDAEELGLSSPVLAGEKLYVTGLVDKVPYSDVAFGYEFEKLVLRAWEMGIGTTWIGGTMKRELFEKSAGLTEGRRMPCVSPLGYPAAKMSIKESLMRRGVKADDRMKTSEIFFEGDLKTPLPKDSEMLKIYEMVRWAPSAVNKQPWRIIRKDGVYHFYEKHDRGYLSEEIGDMQKIDIGIALCHFVMGLEEAGKCAKVEICDPGISVPADTEYIASVTIE